MVRALRWEDWKNLPFSGHGRVKKFIAVHGERNVAASEGSLIGVRDGKSLRWIIIVSATVYSPCFIIGRVCRTGLAQRVAIDSKNILRFYAG